MEFTFDELNTIWRLALNRIDDIKDDIRDLKEDYQKWKDISEKEYKIYLEDYEAEMEECKELANKVTEIIRNMNK